MLNKSKGNMFDWIDATWNVIKGCEHDCQYCFVKSLSKRYGYSMEPRLDEKALKDNLGENKTIFVSATGDMFGEWVKKEWILKVLEVCRKYPKNTYLFQSKNPLRFLEFLNDFPKNTILGTTLETNYINNHLSKAPLTTARANAMVNLPKKFRRMVTLEPLVDFNLEPFVSMIKEIKPEFVNIGADSKGHNLREPSKEDIEALIKELVKFTEVKRKTNLGRLVK